MPLQVNFNFGCLDVNENIIWVINSLILHSHSIKHLKQQMQSEVKQNMFFSLIYELNRTLPDKTPIQLMALVIYTVEFFLLFMTVIQWDHALVTDLSQSLTVIVPTVSICLFIAVQMLLALKLKIHFKLLTQLYFFRYSVVPILVLFLVADLKTAYYLPLEATLAILFVVVVLVYFLSYVVLYDICQTKVTYSSTEYSKYFIFGETLMALASPLQETGWIYSIFFCWALLAFVINQKMKQQIVKHSVDKLTRFVFSIQNYLFVILFVRSTLNLQNSDLDLLTFTLGIVVILFGYQFCGARAEKFSEKVFDGSASLQDFTQFVYIVSDEMQTIMKNQNLSFSSSLLHLFVSLHEKKCPNPKCLLLQPSTQEEMLNSDDLNVRKILMYKITKTMNYVFQLYQSQNPHSHRVTILKLLFLSAHIKNKIKIKQIISELPYDELSLSNKLIVYGSNEKASHIDSNQVLDNIEGTEDQYDLYKKKLVELLVLLRQFWSVLRDEKVDLNSLMRISTKLFPLKKEVEETWKKNIRFENYATWNILKTYASYCRLILHDNTRACIFEDYCKIVEHRMRSKQQLSYVKFESQAGVIAISLSQYSLGFICSNNLLASRMFNFFGKKEMLQLRVNDIMPSLFSRIHDFILSSFLKDRYKKKINQDERLLFGKNKSGFIFPMYLQLRKLSWNLNDELIFISNVRTYKNKSIPIHCIVNLDGEIQDVTSSFAWMFFKKNSSQISRNQNIQCILPSFFKTVEESENENQTKFLFQERCTVKKSQGEFEVEFSGETIIVKQEKIGYLVEGKVIETRLVNTLQERKKLADLFLQNQDFKNVFNPVHRCYEISHRNETISMTNSDGFTIPFMQTADIERIFKFKEEQGPKDYGKNIRVFRLFNNRIELAVEEESFQSDEDEQSWRQFSVIKKMQKMKEDLKISNDQTMTKYLFIIVLVMGLLLICFLAIILQKSFSVGALITSHHLREIDGWMIKALLPEIIIHTNFPNSLVDAAQLKVLRHQLLEALSNTAIAPWQKESMIKILSLTSSKKEVSFEQDLFNFQQAEHIDENQQHYVETISCVLVSVQIFYGLVLFCIYVCFQRSLHSIYSLFLSVSDKKLKVILDESHKLMDLISYNPFKILDVARSTEHEKEEEGDSDDEYQAFKKFQKNSQSKNMNLVYQLMLPISIILVFNIFCLIYCTIKIDKYNSNVKVWESGSSIFPAASILTAQELLTDLNMSSISNETTTFYSLEQLYNYEVLRSDLSTPTIINLMSGDPCLSSDSSKFKNIPIELSNYCSKWTPNSDFSLNHNLNLLSEFLQSKSIRQHQTWLQIIQLEFGLIKPLQKYILQITRQILISDKNELTNFMMVYSLVTICLVISMTVFLMCFPLKEMYEKIMFTRDLLSIIPSDKEKKAKETLATLTTEAIEFKEVTDQRFDK